MPSSGSGETLPSTSSTAPVTQTSTSDALHTVSADPVTSTNAQLVRVDAITSNVAAATTNVSAMTALLAATVGGPVVKVAAFSYGVRSALADRPGSRTRAKVAAQTRDQQAGARAAKRRTAG